MIELESNYGVPRYGSRRTEWLRQAVRQLIFVFLPVAFLTIYFWQFHVTPYQHMYQEDLILTSLFIGLPLGLVLWTGYRVLRFAIGR